MSGNSQYLSNKDKSMNKVSNKSGNYDQLYYDILQAIRLKNRGFLPFCCVNTASVATSKTLNDVKLDEITVKWHLFNFIYRILESYISDAFSGLGGIFYVCSCPYAFR